MKWKLLSIPSHYSFSYQFLIQNLAVFYGSKNKMLIVRIVSYRNYQNIYDIITDQWDFITLLLSL